MNITARRAAFVVLICSCAFVISLGIFAPLHGGLTVREALAGTAGLVVAVVSRLWLRRENRNGDTP